MSFASGFKLLIPNYLSNRGLVVTSSQAKRWKRAHYINCEILIMTQQSESHTAVLKRQTFMPTIP